MILTHAAIIVSRSSATRMENFCWRSNVRQRQSISPAIRSNASSRHCSLSPYPEGSDRVCYPVFAGRVGVAPETMCRWLSGAMIQSRAMDNLMRVFFALPEARAALVAGVRS